MKIYQIVLKISMVISSEEKYGNLGDRNFGPLRFSTIITFPAFWTGSENLPNHPEEKYGNII